MSKKDELNEAMKQLLPESIYLHSMRCTQLEYTSEPTEVYCGSSPIPTIVSTYQSYTFSLVDDKTDTQVVITVNKTINHI